MKLLFTDIDGVLNRHKVDSASGVNGICRDNVDQFNRILSETGAWVVLSSAWRYIVLGGDMTIRGFEYLMRTHGVTQGFRIFGVTEKDESCSHCGTEKEWFDKCPKCRKESSRSDQVEDYLKAFQEDLQSYAIIDDLDLGFSDNAMLSSHFVHVDGICGLSSEDADKVIEILGKL